MGFRSTFTTQDYEIEWPKWFIDKYYISIAFEDSENGVLHSRHECKVHKTWKNLPKDIQKAINWEKFGVGNFILLFLHECGGITRCQIEKERILWSEPASWTETDGITHNYCDGCSDVK